MRIATKINIRPSIDKAEDVKSITAYCHYLVMKAQLSGNLRLDGHRPTEEENRLAEQCRLMCGKISRSLDICKVKEIPNLLEFYDITYRIGYKTFPDPAFIRRYKQWVFKAWKAGEGSVAESIVFGIVAPDVSYHPEAVDREYLAAYLMIKEKWIATLTKYDRFPEATSYENYQRLALMMRENLDRELGKGVDDAKDRWYERNRVDDLTTLGTLLLRSYRRFAASLFPKVLDYEEVIAIDNRILEELSTRPEIPSYDRDAFRMAQQFNMTMV